MWLRCALTIAVCSMVGLARAEEPVKFERDVAPILVEHCVRCHRPESKKGDVSLVSAADLKASEAVEPGKPAESVLLEVVGARGRRRQAEDAQRRQGADDAKKFRSCDAGSSKERGGRRGSCSRKPRKPGPIGGRCGRWHKERRPSARSIRLMRGFERDCAEGLEPSPPADRRTLIRRVTLRPDRIAADARGSRGVRGRPIADRL